MTDKPELNVVQLHSGAMAADIVGSLRRAADSIEAETVDDDRTVTGCFVQITEGGEVRVYGWGKVGSRFEQVGFLQAAINDLV